MGFRFFRRMKIAPGITLNLSKSGPSISIGGKGAHYTVGTKRSRTTLGIPGTGLRYTTTHSRGKGKSHSNAVAQYGSLVEAIADEAERARQDIAGAFKAVQAHDSARAMALMNHALSQLQHASMTLNSVPVPRGAAAVHRALQGGLNGRIEGVAVMKAAIEGDNESLLQNGWNKYEAALEYDDRAAAAVKELTG
ncbi:MAG: hypothetical protein NVSMB52_10020 [Chloroflexota bacterium]